jgi:YaiO family outer membrane protein
MRKKIDDKTKESILDGEETKALKNRLGIENSFELFDIVYDPMIYSSLEYGRETGIGLALPRINYSNRFNTNGIQYEMDFYPKFSKSYYGYLNYGYSNAPTYPNHRVGIELFANLPKSLEVSLGMRYLEFDDGRATIYTGSISLYKGSYYFSLRPYITPKTKGNFSFAGELIARKYFKDGENYLGLRGGMGYSPELRQFKDGNRLLAESVLFLESERLRFEYQFTGISNMNLYRANVGVNRQELVFATGNFFWAFSAGITYQIKF